MKIASIVTIIGCCSLRSVQAQAASNSNCPEERNNPPPLNTICGQSGTLPNSASSFNVVGGLASSAADCAQQCADAYEAQCKFFAYTPPDPQCNPEDFSCGLGSCGTYRNCLVTS